MHRPMTLQVTMKLQKLITPEPGAMRPCSGCASLIQPGSSALLAGASGIGRRQRHAPPHQLARSLVGPTWSVMVSPLGRLGRAPDLSWS